MPDLLPEVKSKFIIFFSVVQKPIPQFPNIFRFITEHKNLIFRYFFLTRIALICLISMLLLTATINQSLELQNNIEREKKLILDRKNIEKEINFWEKIAEKYQDYPDIYLKIASLEYKLGDKQAAQIFIDKALSINPDAKQARVLGEKISRY